MQDKSFSYDTQFLTKKQKQRRYSKYKGFEWQHEPSHDKSFNWVKVPRYHAGFSWEQKQKNRVV
ncbi:MAG: hypothetical protein DRQ49_08920 [Gammaproteobacteria bacterium]|nr:MAG: hypothetical protein DRQ49_08920 [Gammaproteobacteria bacterium]RKZ42067.1 MAG: hypothetical protein DRQ41_07450 [Gammaproteobacteria bacterium]RKZ75588.1 MAG: hypothetical protein DRQ57_06840 [Gammaproteobacteria bacterium]